MFDDDARLAAKELDLVLTTRDRGKDNIEDRIPMCGVPYHSSESYIARLLAKGYKVAICEQMEDLRWQKGLVLRDIVRVITPGTVMDSSMLVESKPNYICSVYMDVSGAAACFAEISTGEFYVTAFEDDAAEHLANEIGRYQPSEAILNSGVEKEKEILELFDDRFGCLRQFSDEGFNFFEAAARLCEQFGVQDVDSLGLGDHPAAVMAAGGLLSYLYSTQKTSLKHIDKLEFYTSGRYMELSVQTRRNLELTETILTKERRGSLIWCSTRRTRRWAAVC